MRQLKCSLRIGPLPYETANRYAVSRIKRMTLSIGTIQRILADPKVVKSSYTMDMGENHLNKKWQLHLTIFQGCLRYAFEKLISHAGIGSALNEKSDNKISNTFF